MKTTRTLGIVVVILLAAATLWGVLTYRLENSASPHAGGSPAAADVWSTLVVLAIGLLAGYLIRRCLMPRRELLGGVWVVLTGGVGGAQLGGALPSPDWWRWHDVNIPGSIILALVLAVGMGWLGTRWGRTGGDR